MQFLPAYYFFTNIGTINYKLNHLFFNKIHMMIGAPNKALTVFIGNVYVGIWVMISQTSSNDAPQSIVAGNRIL